MKIGKKPKHYCIEMSPNNIEQIEVEKQLGGKQIHCQLFREVAKEKPPVSEIYITNYDLKSESLSKAIQ